jgi:hypothetical protein
MCGRPNWKHGLRIRLQDQPFRYSGCCSNPGEVILHEEIRNQSARRHVASSIQYQCGHEAAAGHPGGIGGQTPLRGTLARRGYRLSAGWKRRPISHERAPLVMVPNSPDSSALPLQRPVLLVTIILALAGAWYYRRGAPPAGRRIALPTATRLVEGGTDAAFHCSTRPCRFFPHDPALNRLLRETPHLDPLPTPGAASA